MKSATTIALGFALIFCLQTSDAKPIKLVTANYPPFSYEECGQLKGSAVAIVKTAFNSLQQEVQIRILPFPRAIQAMKNGEYDGIFPFAKTPERMLFAQYPEEPLLSNPSVLFVRSNSAIIYDGDFSKIRQYKFGMQRNTDQGALFSAARKQYSIEVDEAIDQQQNIQKLLAGRFDIGVGPGLVVTLTAKKLNALQHIKILSPEISKGDTYIGFNTHKHLEILMSKLSLAIREMKKNGMHNEIIQHSLQASVSTCHETQHPTAQ